MREVQADLWAHPADAVVITTNGDVTRQGLAVMGRGVALQAAERFPLLRRALAESLGEHGNVVNCWDPYLLGAPQPKLDLDGDDPVPPLPYVVTFPVKDRWREPAKLSLIASSAERLVFMTDAMEWETVALPRPGCGNGGLDWGTVRPLLAEILDDRFVVVDRVG